MSTPQSVAVPDLALQGDYFSAGHSRAHKSTLRLRPHEDGVIWAEVVPVGTESPQPLDSVPVAALQIEPPLVGLPRRIVWPSGGAFVTPDHAAAEDLARLRARTARQGVTDLMRRADGTITRLESRWSLALGSVLLTVLFVIWAVFDGVPRAANALAQRTPPDLLSTLDEKTIEGLDGQYLSETELSAAQQQRVKKLFDGVVKRLNTPAASYHYELHLRHASDEIGANAFALPGGTVVMTDQLVNQVYRDLDPDLADQGIVGVLAHEVGHVQKRHSLAGIYQGLGLGVLLTAATGDLINVGSLAVAAPTFLIKQGYSRRAEYEADQVGGTFLIREYGTTQGLREALVRLEEYALDGEAAPSNEEEAADARGSGWEELLLTHPDTAKRVEQLTQLEAAGGGVMNGEGGTGEGKP